MIDKIKANISVWHIFIPVVPLFAAFGTADRIIHFIWAGAFSLIPITIFFVLYKKKVIRFLDCYGVSLSTYKKHVREY